MVYDARARGCSIYTQREDWYNLKAMVGDAVFWHLEAIMPRPKLIRMHFVRDEARLV